MPEELTRFEKLIDRFASIEVKSDRPNFGQGPNYADQYGSSWRWTGWGPNFRGQQWGSSINYARETGPLDESSLVMAVCNDTGISLAEAEPAVKVPDKSGAMQPVPGHPLAQLISNPNPYYIWDDVTLAGAFSYWTAGNWYMLIVRNDLTKQPLELWYLPHFLVKPRWPNDGGSPEVPLADENGVSDRFLSHYQYNTPGGAPVLIPRRDMVHLKRGVNLGRPQLGIGAFEPLITEIYGDKKASQFAATVLRQMGIVVPILSPKDPNATLDETQALAIKEKWMNQTTGDNTGSPLVNTIAIEAAKFAWSPDELDLKEMRMVPESRVAAVTRYPAAYLQFLVGLKNGTSYASYKEAREQAYESVIVPIQNGIARRISQQLIPEFEKTKGAQFYFNTDNVRVLQEDQDNLFKRGSMAYLSGWLMKSEVRRMAKLNTTPEDEVYYVPPGGSTTQGDQELPKGLATFADIDRILYGEGGLEDQMKEFTVRGDH